MPSAVSQHVARLEAQLGLELLIRPRSGVTATAHGEALREAGTHVLAELANLQDRMSQLAGRPQLPVGVFASAAAELLPAALLAVRQQHPGLGILLREYDSGEGMRASSNGRVDVLLAYNYRQERSSLSYPAIRVEQVGVEPLLLCAARNSSDPAAVERTAEADWVCRSRAPSWAPSHHPWRSLHVLYELHELEPIGDVRVRSASSMTAVASWLFAVERDGWLHGVAGHAVSWRC